MNHITTMVRRDKCRRAGCQHDMAICEDLAASCPNGEWGPHGGRYGEMVPPPVTTMAASYLGAMARDVVAGFPRRSAQEVQRITGICAGTESSEKCEYFNPINRRCMQCWCPIAAKIPMEQERCPIGKW